MLSRRNIRVKVMQTLYTTDKLHSENSSNDSQKLLKNKFSLSKKTFTYLIHFLTEVARYAEKDAAKRAGKHLPTAEDLAINTKIAGNELVWKIVESPEYQNAIAEYKIITIEDNGLLRKIYDQLVLTPEYKEYIEENSRDKRSERKILELIFNQLMLPNEEFEAHIEELFLNWDDDGEQMQSVVNSFLSKPNMEVFEHIVSEEKWKFAKDLLATVESKREHLLELIKPKLNNWDAERIASLDLILLQMGVAEFLYFDTIPTKVTINEYIDLAKSYSTPQSGQFVNGLLDNINKELTKENKIEKISFKKNA